jgi:signal transduction histidine kinase
VQALNEGALAYITKPLNMDEVLATVREALEKQRLVIENRELFQEAQRELAERKRAEEALKEYSERLEEMVEQRTKELRDAQEQLIRAERLAAISQLGASVCHELGNPLGVINNSVYYLSTLLGDVDGKAKKHLNIMKREIVRAKKITSDLLSLTEGKKPTLQKIQINTIVQAALSHTPAPDTVAVITDLGGDMPPVMADPDQIEQVFINLILNAVQAMTSPSPRPEVADESRSRMSSVEPLSQSVKTPDGGRLEIATRVEDGFIVAEFKDNGHGISEENLEKIFEPLFTTKARGIGLGLALSKKIIEAHGGSIEVEREAEKGATFRVKFPNVAQPVTEYRGEAWLIKVAS